MQRLRPTEHRCPNAMSRSSPRWRMPEITRILLIEDHPLIRAGVRRLLAQSEKFELLEAERGQAGLELNKRHRPAVVLLDLDLPDGNGLDLMPALVADNAAARIV